ncbi:hypothetical protein GCM10010124_06840 [Pilimelia terevasa]|uniref:Uncharacterized protein n=1 Tax=Pilimelia terevasa TaxID=53372 RepID=A0A8J3BIL4_9ACTN|nr:hypothetical protein [Pilimelia terevasa]GGK16927.1 hypothetical protein GCM10010124_06840 [Pilimelia terevasa]
MTRTSLVRRRRVLNRRIRAAVAARRLAAAVRDLDAKALAPEERVPAVA